MRVFEVASGSRDVSGVRQAERPLPVPGPGQIRVRMRAASLNYRDLAIVHGHYARGPITRNTIPLSDGAGEVVALGEGATRFQIGDRVVANFTQGTPPLALGSPLDGVLAEQVVFDETGVLPAPPGFTFEQAATLPCAGVTAWNALFGGKVLRPGRSVLTLGTGGVSIFALQLAKLAGARVIITSSSDEKLARARALGADETINYRKTPDWEKAVLELTGGKGVDHVVETSGAGTLPRSIQAIGQSGEIALIGVLTRLEGSLDTHPLMLKTATLRGLLVGGQELFAALLAAVSVMHLEPVIDSVFAFDHAPRAYELLKSGQHFGKIVIRI